MTPDFSGTVFGVTVVLEEDLRCDEDIAIPIEANDVVVDLAGYTIAGTGGVTHGILVDGSDVVAGAPSPGSSAANQGRLHSRIEGFVIGVVFREARTTWWWTRLIGESKRRPRVSEGAERGDRRGTLTS